MTRIILLGIPLILLGTFLSAQQLQIVPEEIHFENRFDRLQNVYFINTGTDPLIIDTIMYKHNNYFIRFSREWDYPQTIAPGDTFKMDCILGEYAVITVSDTLDTMSVWNDESGLIGQIKIRIGYHEDQFLEGIIQGQVTDSAGPLERARVYFLYSGNYIIRTTFTDENGEYSAKLPPGNYITAVQKDSYYVSFYQNKSDPFEADRLLLFNDSILTLNFQLSRMVNTGISISGVAKDLLSNSLLRRGTIVARRGRHTPNKISIDNAAPSDIFVSFINYNGTYSINNIIDPGFFYLQSFSDYYIPAYYTQSGDYPAFWQDADSIFADSDVQNINFLLQRDSSTGDGKISGAILNAPGSDIKTGITVFAQSLTRHSIFNYAFGRADTAYRIYNLPYGTYKIIGEKPGYENAVSEEVVINPENPEHTGIDLIFRLAAADEKPQLPENVLLYQNYPNPFNPSTTVKFYLPEAMVAKLLVTNILGEEAARLEDDFLEKGEHEIMFNATGLSTGIYFIQLITPRSVLIKKIMLIK